MATLAEARQALLDVTTLAQADLERLWAMLVDLPPEQVRDALMDLLPAVGDEYGAAAAALAADWYDEAREEAEVRGAFRAEPSPPVEPVRWQSLSRWGVGPLFAETPDYSGALQLVQGGLQRTVANQHRLTVVDNSIRDPQAAGWRRVGVGGSCPFCLMLIARGAVYTDASVTFRTHDHCNCAASPTWAPNVVKVSGEPYRQSKRREGMSEARKKAENARAREWMLAQYGSAY